MSLNSWLELLTVILLGTVGQVALKYALQSNTTNRGIDQPLFFRLLLSSYLWIWFFCYVLATVLWLIVLKSVPLSQAFPLMGLTFALVPLASHYCLKEKVTEGQWLGIIFIVTGVALVIQT